jgi:hypothetical protein
MIQLYRDEDTEDADSPGGSPERAGAAETIKAPWRNQENGRPDTTSASTNALRKRQTTKVSSSMARKPRSGGVNMSATPDDIPVVAGLFDRSPPQWDPEVSPTSGSISSLHLFPKN